MGKWWFSCAIAVLAMGHARTLSAQSVPSRDGSPLPHQRVANSPQPGRAIGSWNEFTSLVGRSPIIQEAEGKALQAEGIAKQRLSTLLPQLSAGLSGTRHLLLNDTNSLGIRINTIPDPAFTWQAQATLRVPVFVPRAMFDYFTATRATKQASLQRQDAMRRAMANAMDGLVTLAAAQQLNDIGAATLTSAVSAVTLTERARDAGFVAASDVVRAQQEVSLIRITNARLGEDVVRAKQALGSALGFSSAVSVASSLTPAAALKNLQAMCPALRSIESRPDVRAAEVGVETAKRDVSSTYLAHLPTVEAFSTVTYYSDIVASVPERISLTPNGLHTTWIAGAVLTVPLFDGGLRYGQRKELEGRLMVARASLQAAKQDASREVEALAQLVDIAERRAESARANRDLAQEAARLTTIAFKQGRGTTFDLLETQRRAWLAERDVVLSEMALAGAKVGQLLALAECRL